MSRLDNNGILIRESRTAGNSNLIVPAELANPALAIFDGSL